MLYSVRSVKIVHFLIRISGVIGRRTAVITVEVINNRKLYIVKSKTTSPITPSRFESGLIHDNNQIINLMKRTPLFAIWAISFALTVLLANEMNIVFWLSFTVFALCSIYLEKHQKRLKREK